MAQVCKGSKPETFSGFFALLWARIAFWKHARAKRMDQVFMEAFNKSHPQWVRRGWVKKSH